MIERAIKPEDMTRFLRAPDAGAGQAVTSAFEAVYAELRQIAAKALTGESDGHTLQPTALVHEVWLRLHGHLTSVQDRDHMVALAVVAMRRVLIDHARARRAMKRGGDKVRLTLLEQATSDSAMTVDPVVLAEAHGKLQAEHERAAQVFELRVYGSLPLASIATLLDVAEVTVRRDWKLARLWMLRELLGTDANE